MRKKNPSSQIRTGAIISYIAIVVSTLSALLYTPWMKNQIGDSHYGLYTLVGSLIAIFMMDFGLSSSVTRFVAKYRAENDERSINDVFGYVMKLYIVIDIMIAVALAVFYFCIDGVYVGLSVEEREVFKKVYLIFGSYSLLSFPFTPLAGLLNAFERFVEIKLCDMFQKLFAIVLIVVALLNNGGVVALVLMNSVAGIAAIVIKLAIVMKNGIARPNLKVKNAELLKSLLFFSIWVTILAFAERMIFNIAPSILGITSNSMEIARFAPASQLEGYFFAFAFAINGLFLPTVARYDHQEQTDKFEQLMIKVGRYQILVLGLLFTGIVVLAPQFVSLWMGEEYRVSGYCTILLILPSLLQYPQQIANNLLSVRNKIKYQAIIALSIGLINIALSFLLTPRFGVWGSSISIMVAYFVNFILLNFVYHKQLQLKLTCFYKQIYLKHLPLIAISILLSMLACFFIGVEGWLGFAIKGAICTAIYVVVICIFAVSSQEKKTVIDFVRGRLTRKNT